MHRAAPIRITLAAAGNRGQWRGLTRQVVFLCLVLLVAAGAEGKENDRKVLIRDITTVAGVRDNQLVGYGIVAGLNRTGDSNQTVFSTQSLANAMRRMGVQINPTLIRTNNVASVFVTASLPAFARPGMTLDVTVSSIGDAKSLEGGVLLLTPLHGPDGLIYANAQGPLTLGGYTVSANANSKMVNHATVGRVPQGAIVERDTSVDLSHMTTVSLMLRDLDFTAAREIADEINHDFRKNVAVPVDSRRVDITVADTGIASLPVLISRVQNLAIRVQPPAKVVVNERTGTIVMGGDVKLSAVSVLHGNLSIEVSTTFNVSQPAPFSKTGQTVVVPDTTVRATEAPAKRIKLAEGANVEDLINGLHAIGATARDIVAILQAIKAAGGLQAELEVL
jgi:flagellar P-ring protein precursor FlgI